MGEGRGVCPRLVDYLCIVGSNKPPHRPYTTQQPDLLTRYPTTDHKDFPLPRDMVYFCQPDGCTFTSPKRPQARETQSFIFTLTDKDSGITRFGICLNFYRGIEKKGSPKASSKRDSWTRGTDRSTDSAFSSDYRSHSTVGPSDSDRERDTPRDLRDPAKVNEPLEPVFEPRPNPDSDNETIDPKNRRRRESGRKPNSKTQSLTSVCLISSHPFFSSFRSCLASFKRLVDACSGPNSRSKDRSGRKGSDQVWRVLTGAGSESVSSFLLHDIREIETWILRLLSAPIPISGRTRLEMEMIDRRYGPLLIFALPDPTRFTLCDFPLHLPLELLGVETTLQALTLIMLESKILVESRDLNALSLSVLSLTHLLYPLQYMFPVIPILPTSMIGAEQLLLAPTPYIIGLPSSFLPSKKNFSVPDDVWRVNLDSGKITPPPSQTLEDIPPLPEPEGKTLRSHLRQAVASLSIQPISNLDLMHPDKVAAILRNSRELDPSPSGYNPFIYGNDVDSVDIATRVAMVRFFNSPNVLANFTEHTRTLRLYPRPVVALQVNSLINSRPKNSTFITKLSSTQAVEFYAEWALMPSNLAFQRIHTGVLDPIVIGDKFKWYAHNLDPVSYIVWDNLSSLNQALKSLKEVDTPATDESGSDSECGSTSSSFSSCSDGIVHPNSSLGLHTDRSIQEQSYPGYLEKSERTSSLVNQSMNHQSGPILPVEETYTVRRQPPQLHGEHPSSEFQNRGWERSERSFGSQNGIPFGSMKVSHPRCPARSISPRGRLRPNVLEPQGCKTLQATRSCPIETELNPTRGSPFFGQPLGPTRSYPARSTRNYPGEGIEPNLLHPSDLSFSTPHPEPIRSHPSDASFSTPHSAPCHQPNQTFPLKYPGSELTSTDRRQQSPHQLNSSVPFDGVRRLEGGVLRRNTGVDQSRYTGVDQSSVYNPPKDLQASVMEEHKKPKHIRFRLDREQVPSTDNPCHQPCSSEESQSEGESLSPLPPEHLNHPGVQCPKAVSEDAFTSESESSTATCKTVRNMGPKNMSQSTSVSFGSELSLEQESKPSSTLNKLAANFSVKFPRSRFSESSSSSGSRKVSESRQSSTEEVAQELFHNIEQFTKQAKKAAESLETAGKSAVEASKYKAIAKGYVKRDTIEDLEDVRKNVVDDFKTAMVKKNDIFKSLGDSGEKKVDEPTPPPGSARPPPGPGVGQPAPSKPTSLDTSSCRDFSRQSSFNTKIGDDAVFDEPESTAPPFLSYIGTDISGLASQTSEFIGGLFDGRKSSKSVLDKYSKYGNQEEISSNPAQYSCKEGAAGHEQQVHGPKKGVHATHVDEVHDPQESVYVTHVQEAHGSRESVHATNVQEIHGILKSVLETHGHELNPKLNIKKVENYQNSKSIYKQSGEIASDSWDFGPQYYSYGPQTGELCVKEQKPSVECGPQLHGDVGHNKDYYGAQDVRLCNLEPQHGPPESNGPQDYDNQGGGPQFNMYGTEVLHGPYSVSTDSPYQLEYYYTDGRGSISMPGSQTGSPTHTPRTTSFSRPVRNNQGPFPRGRRSIMERNSLIRHPSSRSIDTNRLNVLEQKNALSAENHSFIKDIVDQVLSGEGVGWLKINRLRKLMEDENYRNIILTKINRTIDRRIGPDDHLDDVVLKRSVYKGVLKILTSVIHGLEITVGNSGVGGMASAYQLLEISHTHYWTKDIAEPSDHLTTSGGTTVPGSLASTPLGGSRENINKLRIEGSSSLNYSDDYSGFDSAAESPFTSLPESTETSTGDLLKELIHQKKHLLLGRLASLESETESECNNSESGSIITNPAFHRTRGIFSSIRSAVSDTDVESNYLSSRGGSSNLWNCKSSLTSGYRYHGGDMVSTMQLPPPDLIRTYIFQGIINKDRSNIWDNPQVWEDIFLDAVAQEREATGMDTGTDLLMEHYRGLCESEKKRLEHEEDRLLSTMLFNLVAYMVMMQVNKNEIKKKIRRLLGKSHIGLVHSQEVSLLLEKLNQLNANDIDLRPLPSRQVNRQSFTVHAGTDATGDLLFLEVRDDGMVLRTVNGIISERWFFERLVNMTYSPKNKVLCLWRRQGGQTQLHKYYTKKCRDLYYSIKAAMERAASRGTGGVTPGMELGGEFPVQDIQSGEGGLLQVCMEGVGLLFANSKFFVRLDHIRKCFTQKEGIFVLEEFNPKTRKIVQRKYKSAMADQICYAVLCVFSYVAAGQNRKMADKVVKRNVAGHLPSGGVSPRGPMYSDRASLQFKRK